MVIWYPDFCPQLGGVCAIELAKEAGGATNWITPASILSLCTFHQTIKNNLALTDTQIFRALLFSSRRKERARWEARLELGLTGDDHVPYRVNADGSFTLLTGASGPLLATIQTRVATAIAGLPVTSGISSVSVE